MQCSVSLHGKAEVPGRDAEILELNPLISEELCCEQLVMFLLYMNASIHDVLWTKPDVQDSLKTKNYLLGKRRGDIKIFVSLNSAVKWKWDCFEHAQKMKEFVAEILLKALGTILTKV